MSLRTFHLLFILAAVVLCDMFGAWGVYHAGAGSANLAMGIVSFLAGFGLIGYGIWFVRKLDGAAVT